MVDNLHILVLEDEPNDAVLEIAELENAGFHCQWHRVETKAEFLQSLQDNQYDLVLADNNLPSFDGMEALHLFREQHFEQPFIIISGTIGEEIAIEYLKAGATDYVLKGHLARLVPVVRRALEEYEEHQKRTRAEQALIDSEKRYRTLFDKAQDGILVIQAQGRRIGRILDANQAAADMHGYTKKELLSLSISDLDPEETARGIVERIPTIETGDWISEEIVHRKKDGSTIPVDMSAGLLVVEGKKYIIGINRDISEKKQKEEETRALERQLRHAQKMESIGTLAGGIAHDFNNILSAIIGYSEIITMSDVAADDATKQRLEGILNAAFRAKDLVRQILTFSRKNEKERKPVELSQLIKETLKFLRATLPTTIEIRQHIRSDAGLVLADQTQMHQLLMNLCTNAAQAMTDTGGILEISFSKVHYDTGEGIQDVDLVEGAFVELTIKDTGHGMAPEIIERIFDPYFTTKKKGEGSGLGLAVSHGIVRSHGGTIRVTSQPGKGSVFRVYLPAFKREADKIVAVSPEALPRGSEKILLIDDESTIVKIGTALLQHLGYTVQSRENALQALEIFRANPDDFDLVITDMTMPGMTGIKLAQEIRSICPDMPVILCTGFHDALPQAELTEYGIKEVLKKPITIRDLSLAVRKVLDAI